MFRQPYRTPVEPLSAPAWGAQNPDLNGLVPFLTSARGVCSSFKQTSVPQFAFAHVNGGGDRAADNWRGEISKRCEARLFSAR